jgi:hypothetical protein
MPSVIELLEAQGNLVQVQGNLVEAQGKLVQVVQGKLEISRSNKQNKVTRNPHSRTGNGK